VRDSLAVIEEESDRLSTLIDDLLDASRLAAGALSFNPAEVAMDRLAERLAQRFETQSQQHNFVLDFPAEFPMITADEDRITQVLSNLFSNAVKYSSDGGKVTVSGQILPDEIVICVSDEGTGIAPEDVPRVFDLFYRSNEASRKTPGAGLGLYLAKAVVEAHAGRIWVDDRVSDGARICFSLPRRAIF
jgi:signal transduction histidine kinase